MSVHTLMNKACGLIGGRLWMKSTNRCSEHSMKWHKIYTHGCISEHIAILIHHDICRVRDFRSRLTWLSHYLAVLTINCRILGFRYSVQLVLPIHSCEPLVAEKPKFLFASISDYFCLPRFNPDFAGFITLQSSSVSGRRWRVAFYWGTLFERRLSS